MFLRHHADNSMTPFRTCEGCSGALDEGATQVLFHPLDALLMKSNRRELWLIGEWLRWVDGRRGLGLLQSKVLGCAEYQIDDVVETSELARNQDFVNTRNYLRVVNLLLDLQESEQGVYTDEPNIPGEARAADLGFKITSVLTTDDYQTGRLIERYSLRFN